MNTPVLRRLKKSSSTVGSAPTFRIVVLGQSGVGKTAMSVRFVTKRFIGEYDPTLENIYQHTCVVGGNTVLFEIMDTAGQEENDLMMEEKMRWADAFILVYAINDQLSFDEIPRLKFLIAHTVSQFHQQHKQIQSDSVVTIVGNKNDLEPDRMVERATGEKLAESLKSQFFEISVRDGFNDVIKIFEETYREYKRKMAALHANYDGVGLKRKEKSFKYVDRIPRMHGNKRSYVINDISSDVMMSKIDECSEEMENRLNVRNESRYKTMPPLHKHDVSSDVNTEKPKMRSRRNAVVAFGDVNAKAVPVINSDNDDVKIDDVAKVRRNKLLRSTCYSEGSIDGENGRYRIKRRHHSITNYDANNNRNCDVTSDARRCSSHEMSSDTEINRSHVVDNFLKRALSLEMPHPINKHVI